LTKTKKFPQLADELSPTDFPYSIKKEVPNNPKKIPTTFRFRIFSLIIIADNINTINGVQTIITAAEIGDVRLNPLKKVSIFKATPKKAQAIILGKSWSEIF
jgi:hypothetical protein